MLRYHDHWHALVIGATWEKVEHPFNKRGTGKFGAFDTFGMKLMHHSYYYLLLLSVSLLFLSESLGGRSE